jgi:gamma-glutamylcyclotransferase (GGCT)/AIG2-like uncharacterized protein YtfP
VFLGEAQTRPLNILFDLGGFPAMAQGGETSVRGEVESEDEKGTEKIRKMCKAEAEKKIRTLPV